MIRYTAPFFLTVVAGCATFLFWTSQSVQQAQQRLGVMKAELAQERQSMRVLRAEWDYLNRPDRLEALAVRYLDLVPPAPDGLLASVDDLEPLLAESAPPPDEPIGKATALYKKAGDPAPVPEPEPFPPARSIPAIGKGAPPPPAPEAQEGVVFSAAAPVPPAGARPGAYRNFDDILSRLGPQGRTP